MALLHDDLKQMGISSVGHRLTILKSVYDVKKAQDIPTESDHYMPLCTLSLLTTAFPPALPALTLKQQPPRPKPSLQMRRSRISSTSWNSCASGTSG